MQRPHAQNGARPVGATPRDQHGAKAPDDLRLQAAMTRSAISVNQDRSQNYKALILRRGKGLRRVVVDQHTTEHA